MKPFFQRFSIFVGRNTEQTDPTLPEEYKEEEHTPVIMPKTRSRGSSNSNIKKESTQKRGTPEPPTIIEELLHNTPTMTRTQYKLNKVTPVVPSDSWAFILEEKMNNKKDANNDADIAMNDNKSKSEKQQSETAESETTPNRRSKRLKASPKKSLSPEECSSPAQKSPMKIEKVEKNRKEKKEVENKKKPKVQEREMNASSYAKYDRNSHLNSPLKKQALNEKKQTRSKLSNGSKRTMCPPNSDTPFPCPFWGCPFAFKGREEIKKHLILIHHPAINNYNNHYNAGCIRGVDVVGLHEVTRDMFFDRYMKGSQPVLIKGVPENWGLDQWDMDFLYQKYGNNEAVWYDLETEADEIERTCKKFITDLKQSATLYASIIFEFPQEWKKLPQFENNYLDTLNPGEFDSYCRLFVGHTGTFTALHRDFLDTTITAVKGTKRVILFPPDSFTLLQQLFPPLRTKAHREDFVHFFFDLSLSEEDRAKVMDAGGRVAFVQPGYSLYIPGGWYHQVSNLEENTISLSNACVTHHNLCFFIQNEHPEQLNMHTLVSSAITSFHERVTKWKSPDISGRLESREKILKIGSDCKANNNYRVDKPTAMSLLLRLQEEAFSLNAALSARVKHEDEKRKLKVKVEKDIAQKLYECLDTLQDHLATL